MRGHPPAGPAAPRTAHPRNPPRFEPLSSGASASGPAGPGLNGEARHVLFLATPGVQTDRRASTSSGQGGARASAAAAALLVIPSSSELEQEPIGGWDADPAVGIHVHRSVGPAPWGCCRASPWPNATGSFGIIVEETGLLTRDAHVAFRSRPREPDERLCEPRRGVHRLSCVVLYSALACIRATVAAPCRPGGGAAPAFDWDELARRCGRRGFAARCLAGTRARALPAGVAGCGRAGGWAAGGPTHGFGACGSVEGCGAEDFGGGSRAPGRLREVVVHDREEALIKCLVVDGCVADFHHGVAAAAQGHGKGAEYRNARRWQTVHSSLPCRSSRWHWQRRSTPPPCRCTRCSSRGRWSRHRAWRMPSFP